MRRIRLSLFLVGIAFKWHRGASTETSEQRHLAVTIERGEKGASGTHATLGRITFTSQEPDRLIHLSLAGIEDLLVLTEGVDSGTTITHEILVARALGRALSDEVGHYLLKSRAHTSRGLMRAEWPSGELFAFNRGASSYRQKNERSQPEASRRTSSWKSGHAVDGRRDGAAHGAAR